MYDAEYVFKLRDPKEAKGAEKPKPRPKERSMMVTQLTGWLGLTEAYIKLFKDTDGNEQQAATTGQGTVRMLACCEETEQDEQVFVLPEFSANFFKLSSDTRVSPPPVLLVAGDDDPDILQFKRKYLLFQCHLIFL